MVRNHSLNVFLNLYLEVLIHFIILCVTGTVRLFDLRTKGGDDEDNVVVTMHGRRGEDRVAVNSIAMCPLGSYKFALGCADPFVRLYDIRATSGKRNHFHSTCDFYFYFVGP